MPYINCERIFSHQHCMSRPGLFKLGLPDAPSYPRWVCLSVSPNPPDFPPPLIPTVSLPLVFIGFLSWGFLLGLVCVFCKEKDGFAPQAAPPLGQAGWLRLPPHSLHTALYSEPSATLSALLSQFSSMEPRGPRKSPPVPYPIPSP